MSFRAAASSVCSLLTLSRARDAWRSASSRSAVREVLWRSCTLILRVAFLKISSQLSDVLLQLTSLLVNTLVEGAI